MSSSQCNNVFSSKALSAGRTKDVSAKKYFVSICALVILHLPPPDISIFAPILGLDSMMMVLFLGRREASIRPLAPAPIIIIS